MHSTAPKDKIISKDTNPDIVILRRTAKSDVVTMSRKSYDTLADFIVSTLASRRSKFMTLNALLEKAQGEIADGIQGPVLWYLLLVKNDLEARKIVTTQVDRHKVQHLHLVNKPQHQTTRKHNM
jgi:hypothetical protein